MPEHAYQSHSSEQTRRLGRTLADTLTDVVALYLLGELGAGKTTFTQGLVEGFGIPRSVVMSPTFSLVNRYSGGHRVIYHLDLFRIEKSRELDELGIEEMEEEGALMVVEWAEKLGRHWREDATLVRLERAPAEGDAGAAPADEIRRVSVTSADSDSNIHR